MKKIIVKRLCTQYFTALKEIKKGIKAQILDYDEDEEIDGDFAAEEIGKAVDEFQSSHGQQNMMNYDYKKNI